MITNKNLFVYFIVVIFTFILGINDQLIQSTIGGASPAFLLFLLYGFIISIIGLKIIKM
jgi:hypothetical protein